MPISIVVPQLGESVAEGTVSKWLKQVGERVRKEEPLVEIQTDKINVEIPSPAEGTLEKITVAEGTTVLVGTEIGVLASTSAEPVAAGKAPAEPAAAKPAPAAAPPAPSPPPASRPAPSAPLPVAPMRAPSYAGDGGANGGTSHGEAGERNLSPAVRKLMREHQVALDELGRIHGSGVAGRVTRDDLLDYLKNRTAMPPAIAAAAAPAAPAREAGPRPGFLTPAMTAAPAGPREEVIPFTKVRKLIAENMVKSKHTAPHVTTFDEVDMTAIVALRKEWGPKLEAQGVKLTFMP
ncbi:MAG TPA: biotin/lipoyl-containing protein, partial [Dongiaceae bacterium]|nr:biotin/lipoyl-containing protein [Dongiaceae bacterium]